MELTSLYLGAIVKHEGVPAKIEPINNDGVLLSEIVGYKYWRASKYEVELVTRTILQGLDFVEDKNGYYTLSHKGAQQIEYHLKGYSLVVDNHRVYYPYLHKLQYLLEHIYEVV